MVGCLPFGTYCISTLALAEQVRDAKCIFLELVESAFLQILYLHAVLQCCESDCTVYFNLS
jgi:hypothetical protein